MSYLGHNDVNRELPLGRWACPPLGGQRGDSRDFSRKDAKAQREDDMFTPSNKTMAEPIRNAGILSSAFLCVFASLRDTFLCPLLPLPVSAAAKPCRTAPGAVSPRLFQSRIPRGFTLIEMLIVISIMTMLVALAARIVSPAKDSRRTREAARAINVYLSSARNRAMETGRPAGVMLRRFAGKSAVMNLDQCEVPPCYCGETEQSVAKVTGDIGGITVKFFDGAGNVESLPRGLIRANDLIQLNCQGPMYSITTPNDGTGFISFAATVSAAPYDSIQMVPWSNTPLTVPYRIFRAPVKSAATPLQLPASSVIDLDWSGIDFGTSFNPPVPPPPTGDVMILFSPTGAVDRIYIAGAPNSPYIVTQPIFLLVGKNDRVGNAGGNTDTTMTNWQDLNNFWVTINPQTGLVGTDQIAAGADVNASRLYAREGQNTGGK